MNLIDSMKSILCFFFVFLASQATATEWTIIHAGKLLAEPGRDVLLEKSVIIKDGKIDSIADGFVQASSLEGALANKVSVHDLSGYFVLPGLIDMHTHLSLEISPKLQYEMIERSTGYLALRAGRNARRTLDAGFTTVRNLFGGEEMLARCHRRQAGSGPKSICSRWWYQRHWRSPRFTQHVPATEGP